MTYFNNSCKMMMGGRKITHLSQQVKNVITLEWQSRKWFWGIFIHECIKWHIFSTHLFSFLDIPPLDAFYFNFPTITSKPDVPTVEALRRPPLTIVFSWLLIFINHFSKFRKWCFVGSLRQARSPMDTNQRRAVHPRTERNWEFALQGRQNVVIESFRVTSHVLFILGNILIEKWKGNSSGWVVKYEYYFKNGIGLSGTKPRESLYNTSPEIPGLEVKCKIEMLWFLPCPILG